MKHYTLDYLSNIQLHRIVLIGGILFILLFALKYAHAQIEPGNFEFEGADRTYDVYLPDNYAGTVDFPLLICLHPYGWNGQQGMEYTNFNQVADTSDFLVVYPDAVENWNSGVGDNPNWPTPNVNDVGFIDALIDTLNVHYSIDLAKVYVCGFSNGGFMSYKLACELGHRFAAIASIAGVISMTTASNCEPSNTMPILQIHGTADPVVLINGTTGWHSVDETLSNWINLNNCLQVDTTNLPDIDPTDGCTVQRISYTNCIDSSNILYYKVINGGHTWPGTSPLGPPFGNTNQDINASVEIWNFFKDFPPIHCLPEGIVFSTQAEIDNFQINYPGCVEVEGDVIIKGDDISNLNGLNVLNSIGGDLVIGGDTIYPYNGNLSLSNLNGLDNLTLIAGSLKIIANESLVDLAGIESLTFLQGDLLVWNNPVLTSLTGLNSLNAIEGDVGIGWPWSNANASLSSLSGLNSVNSIGGNFYIWDQPSLTSLSGLDNLNSIGEGLLIWGNPVLASLSGLDSLTSIEGHLGIGYNDALISISNLSGLTSLEGNLGITNNNSLTSLSGLDSIDESSIVNLTITNNIELYDCDVWSICQYLISPGDTVVIENNASECNSIEEVQEHCLTEIGEYNSNQGFNIYPNPVSSNVVITYNLKQSTHVTLKILDLSGREMSTLINEVQKQGEQKFKYNSHGLKPGVYFSVLKTNNGKQTKKIVKL